MARRRRRRQLDSYGHARSDGMRTGVRRGGRGFLSSRPRRPRIYGDENRIQRAQLKDGRVVEMRAGDLFDLRMRVGFDAVKVLRGPNRSTAKSKDLLPVRVRKQRDGVVEFIPLFHDSGRPVFKPKGANDGNKEAT